MIAYNEIWLDNLAARQEIEDAFSSNDISEEEKKTAEALYPFGFYTPNIFIRIGLFILTIIIACFSLGLLVLVFMSGIENNIGGLMIFFGLLSYAALEFFVQAKHHYRSGVDDALLWITGICIISGINFAGDVSSSVNALIIFILATYLFLRFTDMLMSAVAALALLAVAFFNYIHLGTIAKATAPFLLMTIAAFIYFFIKKTSAQKNMPHYRQCGIVLEITSLTCFYVAANYYAVREMSNSMFDLNLKVNESIPLGWLFWIFTIMIPFVYVFRGVQKKDPVLIRVGLILVAAIVFTVRYYYAVLPIETAMLLGGVLLLLVSYTLTKWLRQSKNGFTSAEISNRSLLDKMNIETLIIAETLGTSKPENSTRFGGGSFGGGGASGEY